MHPNSDQQDEGYKPASTLTLPQPLHSYSYSMLNRKNSISLHLHAKVGPVIAVSA